MKKRKPSDFVLSELVENSKGFSGAEIQEAVKEALFMAFDEHREPDTNDIIVALENTYPLARVMGEQLDDLRKWAKGRTVPASKEKFDGMGLKQDPDRPVLKREYNNAFIKKKRK
ncbi:MAG TPA: hypothetical protein ENJ82_05575 [Bacteroidetes bacterium]|nr:hypothetical protein [Bacteroidota bacterium]